MANSAKIRVGIVGASPDRALRRSLISRHCRLPEFEISALCTIRQNSAEAALHFANTLSGQFGNRLADGFQLADGFLAEQHWHKGADRRYDSQRAKEDRGRSSIRLQ